MRQYVNKALMRLGYQVQGIRYTPRQLLDTRYLRAIEFKDLIARHMLDKGQALTFLQIGAYDGISTDPLFEYISKYAWCGVLVEPQPAAANKLRELYRHNERITIVEAAIDRQSQKRTLYTIESNCVPDWALGMASFNRSNLAKHSDLIPGLDGMIREVEVDCVTYDDVLSYLPSSNVDLLQIDAEGFDAELLSFFPFSRITPSIIHWEIKNLTKRQREGCFELLAGVGYRFAPSGDEDMMAILDWT